MIDTESPVRWPVERRARVAFVMSLAAALSTACGAGTGVGSDGGPTTNPDALRITFSLGTPKAAPAAPSATARATGTSPDTLLYLDLSTFRPDLSSPDTSLRHMSLAAGANSIDLAKGGVWMLGLAASGSAAKGLATSGCSRDITSAIQGLGSIDVQALGLGSLPVSAAASDSLDLGALAAESDGSGYESSIPAGTAIEALGYSESLLKSFGFWDQFMGVLLNSDIDQDGEFDADEGLFTEFRGNYIMDWSGKATYVAPNSVSDLSVAFNYQIGFFKGGEGLPIGSDEAVLERLAPGTDTVLDAMVWKSAEHHTAATGFYFDPPANGLSTPADGDFKLSFTEGTGETRVYLWHDISFVKLQSNWENLILATIKPVADADGNLSALEWQWLKAANGAWIAADEAEVRLRSRQFVVSFAFKDGYYADIVTDLIKGYRLNEWGIHKTRDGVGVSSVTIEDIPLSGAIPLPLDSLGEKISDISYIVVYWTDLADNYYGYHT